MGRDGNTARGSEAQIEGRIPLVEVTHFRQMMHRTMVIE